MTIARFVSSALTSFSREWSPKRHTTRNNAPGNLGNLNKLFDQFVFLRLCPLFDSHQKNPFSGSGEMGFKIADPLFKVAPVKG
jgi:hypothetical protein